ncbi:MAG: hypothetical protein NVSMB2_08040 [Chloroflexota bacterium]
MSGVRRPDGARPQLASLVLSTTIVGGLVAVTLSAFAISTTGEWLGLLPLLALVIVADRLSIDLIAADRDRLSFSFSIAVVMMAMTISPPLAPLVAAGDGLVHVIRTRNRRVSKILFNLTNLPLAAGAASLISLAVLNAMPDGWLTRLALGLLCVFTFYLVNTSGIRLMIAFTTGQRVLDSLGNSGWAVPINLCLGITGAFLGISHNQLGTLGSILFVVPLGLMRITLVIFANKSQQIITTLQRLNTQLSEEVVQRSTAEAALSQSEAHLRAVLDNVADGILTVDNAGSVMTCNPAAESVFGLPEKAIVGRRLSELVPILQGADSSVGPDFRRALSNAKFGSGQSETSAHRSDGTVFPIDIAVGAMQGDADLFVVSVRDITERKHAQAALEHQAVHDALTSLPNRLLLHDRLTQAILGARRDETPVALMVMDLDRFKEVNGTLGHHYGDLLLHEVGARVRRVLREEDTAARLGGDEFAILLPRATAQDADQVAQRVLEVLRQPFTVDSHPVEIDASIGVAMFPDHGTDAGTLLRRADVAMYVAKRTQTEFAIYSPEHDRHSPDRLALAAELRAAIDNNQLELFYQPQADMTSRQLIGVEALVRWHHPQRGLVPPDEFIPLAEQTGLVRAVSRWLLDAALAQARQWADAGRPLSIAINLSMRDLQDPQLPHMVAAALRHWGVRPEILRIEITESALMADPAQAMDIVRRLSAMGVTIAIDDFGTGYSSLAYLKRLAVHELKVDRSFVRHVVDDPHDLAIVRSTISLAHELGLQVVAEGIEDEETWTVIADLGCDTAQGYLISRPLPVGDFDTWSDATTWRVAPSRPGAQNRGDGPTRVARAA